MCSCACPSQLKVETIGDAYMVVGGVPVPVPTHAERVANFALGMIMAAKGVQNPVSGNPIQVSQHKGACVSVCLLLMLTF